VILFLPSSPAQIVSDTSILKQTAQSPLPFVLTFLSGMILTFCTCPAVSKICLRTSSATRGSSPPTYKARLFGSGAARRTEPPALPGDNIPPAEKGDDMPELFCGIMTGGRGGGGI
jgi:hypothetical protein